MKRVILFVEGDGEIEAAPTLVGRLISEKHAWGDLFLDPHPFRVGSVEKLVKSDFFDWRRFLGAALKRSEVGAVLLILDGDSTKVGGRAFCAADVARSLAHAAKHLGAGESFSVAIVFARQEFETWLIAGVASLAGRQLPDGHRINVDAKAPQGDLEAGPRDAKGWLGGIIRGGYKPTQDQAALTRMVDIETIRARGLRSFGRLDSALTALLQAIREEKHIVSPL